MKKFLTTLLTLCLLVLPLCVGSAEANDIYILMNIPYADFYATEVDDVSAIDAVTSSTLMKPRAGTLAGGSYHVDPKGSDITGVIFPVRVSTADLDKLAGLGGVEITDESAVEITVTLKGKENTTTYEGANALFEAPSYSWYVLAEAPAQYKALEIEGAPSFGQIEGPEAQTVEAAASFIYDKHANYVIRVTGMDDTLADQQVSAIVLEADGAKVGLRHIANFWRGTEIGFNRDSAIYEALAGKRLDRITFITRDAEYAVDTDLFVTEDETLSKLAGSYIELFPEFAKAEFKDWWMECIKAYVDDDDAAEGYYTALTQNYMGTLRGQAAIDAYGDNPESMVFNCGFTDGLAKLTISGNVISGVDANGDELFRHSYSYLEDLPVSFFGQDMGIHLSAYQSDDADSGVFTYFAFTDDDLNDTQHIEFRYGATLENLANYSEGEYAYWLASGTQDGYKESLLKDCIKLFVDENVGGQGEEAEEATVNPNGVFPAIAGETGTTYVSLFDVIISDRWTPVWQNYIAAVLGEDAAAETTNRLQGSITSNLYGEEAVAAFANGGYAFDCDFINGAQSITFNNDNTVTILKTDGESETHTYEYLGQTNVGETETMMYQGAEISMAFPVDVYKSTDEAGEFNYFLLREDTMAETYHIEFRYGSDLKALQGYMVGPYAYWLAAGIDESADEATIDNVIALFCLENMDYSAHTDAALAQIDALGLVGEWVADLAPLGEAYAGVDLRMTIDAAGHGITLMNGQQTADFEAYACDSGEKDDGEGVYVAYSNTEYEAEAAPYALTINDAGETVLTLTADDGTISWVKQDGETAAESIEIATVEELAAINGNLSGNYVLTADIDLSGIEWTPIGTYAPSGESEEEQEIPAANAAFTGTFDGQGHTISNLTINQPEGWAMGLFGCAANADVGNFTLENASVDAQLMGANVVGYAYCSTVHDIALLNGKVTAHASEMSEGMYGGIVGAGMSSLIRDCSAEAEIILPDNTANAGIVGGGLELTSVVNCAATGSISAGNNCYGLGGVSGCGFGAEKFTNDTADNVTITCGNNCFWIGGITGYAGGFETEETGVPVTAVTSCKALNVTVTTGENPDGVSAIVGASFYNEAVAEAMGAPFDQPTVFTLTDCVAENVTVNGVNAA